MDARDIFKKTQDVKSRRERTMQHIADRCMRHIHRCAEQEQMICYWEVPEVILSLPTYNLNESVRYVQDFLIRRGFQVTYIFPRSLIIGWDMTETGQSKARDAGMGMRTLSYPEKKPSILDVQKPRLLPPPQLSSVKSEMQQNAVPKANTNHGNNLRRASIQQTPHDHGVHQAKHQHSTQPAITNMFYRSIAELKPSGRFVLDLS
jgi:hypothetical protein